MVLLGIDLLPDTDLERLLLLLLLLQPETRN